MGLRTQNIALGIGAVVLSMIGGLIGCANPTGPSARTTPVPVPAPTSVARLLLPLDDYMPSETQAVQQDMLTRLVVKTCLRRFGFTNNRVGSLAESMDFGLRVRRYERGRQYGISDWASAATIGYRMPAWTTGKLPPPRSAEPAGQRMVLNGPPPGAAIASDQGKSIPPGGCKGEAQRVVGFKAVQNRSIADSLGREASDRMKQDRRVHAVVSRWSECMSARGYSYPSPIAASNDKRWNMEKTEKASPAEIKVAKADVECKFKVNLLGVMFAVEAEYQNAAIERYAEVLEKEKQEVDARARQLQDLVRRYGG